MATNTLERGCVKISGASGSRTGSACRPSRLSTWTTGTSGNLASNTYLLRQADDTAPRVFIGYGGRSGRSATPAEARRFALEILTLVDGQRGLTG